MKAKKVIALVLTASMVFGSSLTVFADQTVNGDGIVEYDDSVPADYDQIEVPTIAAGTYDFTLDPTGQLSKYNSVRYGNTNSVYFSSEQTPEKIDVGATLAKVQADTTGGDENAAAIYECVKTAVTKDTTKGYAGTIVKEALKADKSLDINPGYYVWVPNNTTKGSTDYLGKFEEIGESNIEKYFDIEYDSPNSNSRNNVTKVTIKANHLTLDDYDYDNSTDNGIVCDDVVYNDVFTALHANVDAADYKVVSGEPEVTTYKLYFEQDIDSVVPTADVVTIDAESRFTNTSNIVKITNKSTKDKTVTATITMTNAAGLTFKEADSYTDDANTSVYFAATDGKAEGAKTEVLKKAEGVDDVASAVFSVDLEGVNSENLEIRYQLKAGTNPDTLGHSYRRYLKYIADEAGTYNSSQFKIIATSNKVADPTTAAGKALAEKWIEYGKTIKTTAEGNNRPTLTVVYKVEDKQTDVAPSAETTQAVLESGKTAEIAVNLGLGSLAATGVTSFVNRGLGNDWISAGAATYADGKITLIKTADVDYLLGDGAANNVFTITFNDTAGTTVNVTLIEKE